MISQAVTLHLPGSLYERLKRRAEQADRTIEAELLDVVTTAVPAEDLLPTYLEEAVSPLATLDDAALWQAARRHLPKKTTAQIERLHLKRQREGLTSTETESLANYMRQYERTMLVRAQAAALLKQRGYDVSELLAGT